MGTTADKLQHLADTKELIKTAIQGKGQSFSGNETFRDYATKIGNISSECTAVASNILSGKTAYSGGSKITGTIASKGAQTYSPSISTRTITAGQYLSGTQTISAITGTAVASNVLSGKTFASSGGVGITGTMTNRGAVTSTITTQGGQYTVPSGYHSGTGKITASFANLSAGNIKSGVNVGGVVGNLVTFGYTNHVLTITPLSNANYYYFVIVFADVDVPTVHNDYQIQLPSAHVYGSYSFNNGYRLNSVKKDGVALKLYNYGDNDSGYYMLYSSGPLTVDIDVLI